jgi:leucyl aminopeptidase (aminopeptidase T)
VSKVKQLIIESSKYGTQAVLYDAEDADKVESYVWHIVKGHSTFYVYRQTPRPNRTQIAMHRELADCPKGKMVDHANKNGLDNRKGNLRICTMSENMMNRKKTRQNSTGHKGVYKTGDSLLNPYSSKIQKDKKVYCLGHYKTPEEAARAYDKKAIELHGEFALLNFPKDKHEHHLHTKSSS